MRVFITPPGHVMHWGGWGGGGGEERLPVPWGILKINPLHSPWCFGQINPYKNYNVSLYSWIFFPQQNIYTLISYFEVTSHSDNETVCCEKPLSRQLFCKIHDIKG